MPTLSISGLQEAQRANMRHIASVKPGGSLDAAVQVGTLAAHRYNVSITHVLTGTLRAAERVEFSGLRGTVFVDPSARNPRTGALPSEYVMAEDRRGGSHASFRRTEAEQGSAIAASMVIVYTRGLR
jgi:hypothetical protein